MSGDGPTRANAARHENRQFARKLRQDFLGQDRGPHRTDMAARFHALNDQRINARPDKLRCQRQYRGEADDLRSARLDRIKDAIWPKTATQPPIPALITLSNIPEHPNLRTTGKKVIT